MIEGPGEDFDGPDRARRERAFRAGIRLGLAIGFIVTSGSIAVLIVAINFVRGV